MRLYSRLKLTLPLRSLAPAPRVAQLQAGPCVSHHHRYLQDLPRDQYPFPYGR
jgi:hypothetical protein